MPLRVKRYVLCSYVIEQVISHWNELLQSVSDFIFSKNYGYRSRDLRGVKRPEKNVINPKLPIVRLTIHPSLSKIKNNLPFFKEF